MADAIQDLVYPRLTCFGCGPANPKGLHLKSYATKDGANGSFTPWPEHDSGNGFLNGGIIATLLDCHGGAAALWAAHEHGWHALPGAGLSHVTAGLDVRYLRPAPLDDTVELRAELTSLTEAEIGVVASVVFEGKVRATGTAVWKRWRPRV